MSVPLSPPFLSFSLILLIPLRLERHLRLFTPLAPSLSNVASFNFERQPEKVHHMRPDALAQLLSFANVGAGGRYIVVDGVGGALVGAVLERMGGEFASSLRWR